MSSRLLKVFPIAIVSLGAMVACTRQKADEKMANLALQLPSTNVKKVGTLSTTSSLEHVIINVTGDGISVPVVSAWDGCRDCKNPPAVPSTFPLEVLQGSNRLIQVLAVYVSDSGSADFYYGDVTQSLSKSDESISISISSLTSGVNIESGSIMGRYFSSADAGPTGQIFVKYTPPGKPSMVVDKSQMVAGWFRVFALKGLNFTYEMEGTGLALFRDVNLDSSVFSPDTVNNRVARVTFPSYAQLDSSTGVTRVHEKRTLVLGWFGDATALATKVICYHPDPEPNVAGPYVFQSFYKPGTTQKLTWSNADPNDNQITMQGARNLGTSGCSDSNQYLLSYMSVSPDLQIANNGADETSISGFTGAFRAFAPTAGQTPRVVHMSPTATDVTVKLAPLFGVNNFMFDSLSVYKRKVTTSSEDASFHDGIPCAALHRGEIAGWSLATELALGADSSPVGMTLAIPQAEQSLTYLAICPHKAEFYPNAGLMLYPYWFSGGPVLTCPDCKYLRYELSGVSGSANAPVVRNQCYATKIKAYQMSSGSSTAAVISDLTLTDLSVSWASLYSDSSCSTALGSSLSMQNSSETSTFYVKPTGTGSGLVFNPTSSLQSVIVDTSQSFNITVPEVVAVGPNSVLAGQCYSYRVVQRIPGSTSEIQNTSGSNMTVSLVRGVMANADIYSSFASCLSQSNAVTSAVIPNGSWGTEIFIRATGNIDITVSEATHATTVKSLVIGAGSPIADHIVIEPLYTPLEIGRCNGFIAKVVNASGIEVPSKVGVNVQVTNSAGTLVYSDGGCLNVTADNTIPIAIGTTGTIFSIMAPQSGTLSLMAQAGGLSSGATALSFTVATPLDVGAPYLQFTPPKIPTPVIGQFQFPILIPFSSPADVTVSCGVMPTPDFTANCGGLFNASTKVFTWTAADAISGKVFVFQAAKNSRTINYTFDPIQLYGHRGLDVVNFAVKGLTVLTCGATLTSGGNFDAITSAFSSMGTSDAVCLDSGTWTAGSSNYYLTIPAGKAIVGKIDLATGGRLSSLTSDPANQLITTASLGTGQKALVANLTLNQASSSGGRNLVTATGSSTGRLYSIYNSYVLASSGGNDGLFIQTPALTSIRDSFAVNESGSSLVSNGIRVSYGNANIQIFNPIFNLTSSGTGIAAGLRLSASTGIASAFVYDSVMSGNGVNFYNDGISTGSSNLTVVGCTADFSSSGSVNIFVKGVDKFSGAVSRCRVSSQGASPQSPITLVENTSQAAGTNTLILKENVFKQRMGAAVIAVNYVNAQELRLVANHFVRLGNVGSSTPALKILGGGQNVRVDAGLPAHGNNLVCSQPSITGPWSVVSTGTFNTVSPTAEQFSPSAMTLQNSVDASSELCTLLN